LDLKSAAMVASQLNEALITELDQNGDGVDQMEFVFGMLRSMGAQLCDEPLDFEKHVAPLIKRFKVLDTDGSGKLDADDLEFMVEEAKRQHTDGVTTTGSMDPPRSPPRQWSIGPPVANRWLEWLSFGTSGSIAESPRSSEEPSTPRPSPRPSLSFSFETTPPRSREPSKENLWRTSGEPDNH